MADEEIEMIIDQIIADFPKLWREFEKLRKQFINQFMGLVMKEHQNANPIILSKMLGQKFDALYAKGPDETEEIIKCLMNSQDSEKDLLAFVC